MGKKTIILIGIIVLILAIFLGWLFKESSKPLPGEKLTDLGREHIGIGTEVKYNSNPPTSGPHYADWIKAGVYSEPKDDRNLVHSLEHGYVIMSYKCSVDQIRSEASESAKPEDQCQQRQDQLKQVYDKKGGRKLIVIPRADLETNFALTAWTYLDKFDEFDEKRVTSFIDAHRDQGPEATME